MVRIGIGLMSVLLSATAVVAQTYNSDVFTLLENAGQQNAESAEQAVETAAAEVVAQAQEVSLLEKGVALYRADELAKAENVFEAVLVEDPYNRTAMTYLQRIASKLASISQTKQSADRAMALAEVERTWNQEPRSYGLNLDEDQGAEKSENELAIEAMTQRVEAIQIPSLDFRDADIRDVVIFLTETCLRQDAEGINILTL